MPRNLAFLVAALLATMASALPPLASADEPVILDRTGTWTLPELGYGPISLGQGEGDVRDHDPLAPPERYAQPAIQYAVSPSIGGARDRFLILHLHAEVQFAPGTGPGKAYIYGMTNSMASAMVEFTVSRLGSELVVAWNQLGLIDGREQGRTTSRVVDVDFRNYVNDAGRRAGTNTLEFSIREAAGVQIGRLLISEQTALEVTTSKPPELSLTAVEGMASSPNNVSLDYELKNVGGWPARDASIDVVYPNQVFALLTPTEGLKVRRLNPGEVQRGTLMFEIQHSGSYEISLEAKAAVGSGAGVIVTGSLMDRSPPPKHWYLLLITVVILASLAPLAPLSAVRRILRNRQERRRGG